MNIGYNNTAVLLINMGGPETLAEVNRFMYRLFMDPHIMTVPGPIRHLAARIISFARAPRVKAHYALIGGGSPIKEWTSKQADLTSRALAIGFPGLNVSAAYSYSYPDIGTAIRELVQAGKRKIIVLPLYPQYSAATWGSIQSQVKLVQEKIPFDLDLKVIDPFFENPRYIDLTANYLRLALRKIDSAKPCRVIFTAHALPQSFIDRGDPYRNQVETTVSLLLREYPLDNWILSFQSKIGPVRWMQPSTIEAIRATRRQGIKQAVVLPVGFVCDHIETLYELDIELADIARREGITTFIRGAVPNDDPAFIKLLASLCAGALS